MAHGWCFLSDPILPPSTYDIDHLLGLGNVGEVLCPDQFPEEQPCSLPLSRGVYGGGQPIYYGPMLEIPHSEEIFVGKFSVEVEVFHSDGTLFACNLVNLVLADH